MAKVKIKVSGCFRTRLHAEAWCRISSYLSSMAALDYNPLVAIQIALAGNAADMVGLHRSQSSATKGWSSYDQSSFSTSEKGLPRRPSPSNPPSVKLSL